MPFQSKANQTSFKKGHIRSSESINKQIITIKKNIALGIFQLPHKPKGIKDHHQDKICQKCKKIYNPNSIRQRWCKECVPDKKSRAILERYGINKTEWDILYNQQKGKCKLCNNKAKVVDHNHKTGEVRSLLCHGCNLLIGLLERDKKWINKAMEYIL